MHKTQEYYIYTTFCLIDIHVCIDIDNDTKNAINNFLSNATSNASLVLDYSVIGTNDDLIPFTVWYNYIYHVK